MTNSNIRYAKPILKMHLSSFEKSHGRCYSFKIIEIKHLNFSIFFLPFIYLACES